MRKNLDFPTDVESSWEEVKSWEKKKAALKVPKQRSLGKQEEKHLDILDAELETGFGEKKLK